MFNNKTHITTVKLPFQTLHITIPIFHFIFQWHKHFVLVTWKKLLLMFFMRKKNGGKNYTIWCFCFVFVCKSLVQQNWHILEENQTVSYVFVVRGDLKKKQQKLLFSWKMINDRWRNLYTVLLWCFCFVFVRKSLVL